LTLMVFRSIRGGRTLPEGTGRKNGKVTVPLSSIADVHRGISTGANKFFLLTDESVKQIGVPTGYLKKIVPTRIRLPVGVFGLEDWEEHRRMGRPCWMLTLPRAVPVEELPPGVRQYIARGESQGINLIPTCRSRRPKAPWYFIRTSRVPDLIFTYMSRNPRFIYNEARAYVLTNLLEIHLKISQVSQVSEKMKELSLVLSGELASWIKKESAGRRYLGGLLKFEPGDLSKMPISRSLLDMVLSDDPHLRSSIVGRQ